MEKSGEKKDLLFFVAVAIILLIPIVTASFWDEIAGITGLASSQTASLSITLGQNSITDINDTDNTEGETARSITESGTTWFNVTFIVKNEGGRQLIDNASAQANFTNYTINASNDYDQDGVKDICRPEIFTVANTTAQNFSCLLPILWSYTNMSWMVNVSILDTGGNMVKATNNFSVNPTAALTISPSSLTWPSLIATDVNKSSDNHPIVLNNTGNVFIAEGNGTGAGDGVRVTALNLLGDTGATYKLNSTGFSIGTNDSSTCDKNNKTWMGYNSAVPVYGAGMGTGKNETQALFFCLRDITVNATAQTYSTTGEGAWTIAIAGT